MTPADLTPAFAAPSCFSLLLQSALEQKFSSCEGPWGRRASTATTRGPRWEEGAPEVRQIATVAARRGRAAGRARPAPCERATRWATAPALVTRIGTMMPRSEGKASPVDGAECFRRAGRPAVEGAGGPRSHPTRIHEPREIGKTRRRVTWGRLFRAQAGPLAVDGRRRRQWLQAASISWARKQRGGMAGGAPARAQHRLSRAGWKRTTFKHASNRDIARQHHSLRALLPTRPWGPFNFAAPRALASWPFLPVHRSAAMISAA